MHFLMNESCSTQATLMNFSRKASINRCIILRWKNEPGVGATLRCVTTQTASSKVFHCHRKLVVIHQHHQHRHPRHVNGGTERERRKKKWRNGKTVFMTYTWNCFLNKLTTDLVCEKEKKSRRRHNYFIMDVVIEERDAEVIEKASTWTWPTSSETFFLHAFMSAERKQK